MTPLLTLAGDLAAGRTTSRELVEDALARIDDTTGEGGAAFLAVHGDTARAAAGAADSLREAGLVASPLAGLPISIKDLFDEAGHVTTAGSVVLKDAPPASRDAIAIGRLRRAGAVIVGRTNMTEFAYSGLGLNVHYGTPKNPWDRATGRIPGGSSAGAAVSVSDGMAAAAIGTDTGGSVRIPAALCGLAGFKPTQRRIPLGGTFPLAKSLDSIGPLAPTVACCALLDAVMAGEPPRVPEPLPLAGLRFAVPQSVLLDGLDDQVAQGFQSALSRLAAAGARITDIPFNELSEIATINRGGGIYAECYAVHRDLLETTKAAFDQRVAMRILRVKDLSAADYLAAIAGREDLIRRANPITRPFDGLLAPTCAIVAPPMAELDEDPDAYGAANILLLRNTFCFNFLDRCALTIPIQPPGEAPVGLMLVGETGGDDRILSVGLAVEAALAG